MMTIYKERAIEAIATEPLLKAGQWFRTTFYLPELDKMITENLKECPVCAVGTILREHCFTTKYTEKEAYGSKIENACNKFYCDDDFKEHFLENRLNYLGNLSMAFEHLAMFVEETSDDMRLNLISVIEATWPDQFEVDL